MSPRRLYFDHHAATPLADVAREAMRAALEHVGNPSSVHFEGRAQRRIVEAARSAIATAAGIEAASVVFTGGGTEACNLGVLGLGADVTRVITTRIEHPAVARAVDSLARGGASVVYADVSSSGTFDLDAIGAADARTLVAVQWVNHETGHVLPVADVALRARSRGARCFIDATQAFGKVPFDLARLGATAVALASHKIGGPAGAGALVVERGIELVPRLLGGSQERGLRGGTEDVVALAGFGAATDALESRLRAMQRIGARRDALEAALLALGAVSNAPTDRRVATVVNVSLPRWRSDWLVAALDAEGLSASSGAACAAGAVVRSPVIEALFPEDVARHGSALRLSIGPETTDEMVDAAIAILRRVIPRAA